MKNKRTKTFIVMSLCMLSLITPIKVNAEVYGLVNGVETINIRTKPGTNYTSLEKLQKNNPVKISSTIKYKGKGCALGWYKINYNNKERYVCSKYIKKASKNSNVIITNLQGINVRTKPTTKSKIIIHKKYASAFKLSSNKKYAGLGCKEGWYKLYYKDRQGYICSKYATKKEENATIININGLNVRKKPTINSIIYKKLNYNEKIIKSEETIYKGTGCKEGWNKINLNGSKYYICSRYISNIQKSTTIRDLNANIRINTNESSKLITTLEKNSAVLLIGSEKHQGNDCVSGWYKVKINGGIGYVCSDYTDIGPNKKFDNLILVNKQNRIASNYDGNIVKYKNHYMSQYIINSLEQMSQAALKDGVTLVILNAYRTPENQKRIYDNTFKKYLDEGYPEKDADEKTNFSIMKPYYSEHQTGLAIDFQDKSLQTNNAKQIEWLKNNSYKYGFILRYPQAKVAITQIIYEPWHYRYVGEEVAKEIHEKNLTLEEYLEKLAQETN